jgi:hypothetical protein
MFFLFLFDVVEFVVAVVDVAVVVEFDVAVIVVFVVAVVVAAVVVELHCLK